MYRVHMKNGEVIEFTQVMGGGVKAFDDEFEGFVRGSRNVCKKDWFCEPLNSEMAGCLIPMENICWIEWDR